jgi:hypothetical protein
LPDFDAVVIAVRIVSSSSSDPAMEAISDWIVTVDTVETREVLDCREVLAFGGRAASNFLARTKNGQFGSRLSCSFLRELDASVAVCVLT